MIILRVSPGLANSMYEFAAGYALAKVRNEPLTLDIAACISSAWSFQLDHFRIPDVEKIVYAISGEDISHSSANNIPPQLLGTGKALSDVNPDLPSYDGLEQGKALQGDPLMLCGYFFSREKYYAPYWDKLRNIFLPREPNAVLECFEQLAQGYDTVGVHIRRGDFLVADFAYLPTADYFRAGVAWYRKRLARPRFFIFSDDIAYAREILGVDSSFFYVHPLGIDTGAFSEFLCLSRCRHKIVSNDSTFSRLAHELNTDPGKTVLHRERESSPATLRDMVGKAIHRIRKRLGEWRRQVQQEHQREFYMDAGQETAWSRRFVVDGKNSIPQYAAQVRKAVVCQDDAMALATIDSLFMNVAHLSPDEQTALAWRKLCAHAGLGQHDRVLELAYEQWFAFDDRPAFHRLYAAALLGAGFAEEAAVEMSRCLQMGEICGQDATGLAAVFAACAQQRFLVLPRLKELASTRPGNRMTSLGITLRRLGHDITFLFRTGEGEDEDTGESWYIDNNALLTTRTGVCMGCTQYRYEDIAQHLGIQNFLEKVQKAAPATVIVTDDVATRDLALSCGLRVVFCGAATDSEESGLFSLAIESTDAPGYAVQSERWSMRQNYRLRKAHIQSAGRICRWLSADSSVHDSCPSANK
ncbi:MAG: alpha-1,2-fucosyltransferase [Desulfobulbus sp.]